MTVCAALFATAVQSSDHSAETATRAQIAAASFEDTIVVDCQLPGRVQQLGAARTYLTAGPLMRLPAIDCRTRGGEYTMGDLASGTLSLKRWLPLANQDNVEAQYYVARIYANGMDGVPVDYELAAKWYQRAVQKKYAPAMEELGYLYEQGLGVPKDPVAGINLQRAASGLGEDLVYASTLAANKEQAEAQIALLTDDLKSADAVVVDLQGQLTQADDKLAQNHSQLSEDQARLRDLRSKLEQARRDGGTADLANVQRLQQQLAASEAALKDKQDAINVLSADQGLRQAQLSAQLARSQATNTQLSNMLAAGQSENESLRARLAQAEQRAVQSQQEVASVRADFVRETRELSARSAELTQLREHGSDGLQSLLSSKQGELERQQKLLASLESQLASLRQQVSSAGSGSSEASARNKELEATLAALRIQYAQQQQQLQDQRADFARLQSQSKDDRSALLARLSAQLDQKSAELQDKQHRLDSLQAESSRLRDDYNREHDARARDGTLSASQLQQDKEALRVAQDQLAQQRASLQQLELQSATQQLQLVQERERFARALAGGQQADQQRIATLEAGVRARDQQIADARARVSTLEQQNSVAKTVSTAPANNAVSLSTPVSKSPVDTGTTSTASAGTTSTVSYRLPQSAAASGNPFDMVQLVKGLGPANYYALVIGNSKYEKMQALKTAANDARDVAKLLEGRYGFQVKLLIDATRADIGRALYEYARSLSDSDRLLIYYAGHGGSRVFPPERAYWTGVDSDPDNASSWIGAQDVSDDIAQIHARHILLVADSCFSSVITHQTSTIVAPSNDERSVRIKWARSARMVLTSGRNEPVVDSADPQQTHSLFAEQFLTVLRQNTILLSGQGLAHELSGRVEDAAARTGLKQTPTYSNLQDQQHMFGDFFFVPLTSVQVASTAR
ncbi:MAG TPA: caspase family protein [Steroidobacteraceae bacterium]|nr:caspase family protein [Steroidobacteraceae bacterium]